MFGSLTLNIDPRTVAAIIAGILTVATFLISQKPGALTAPFRAIWSWLPSFKRQPKTTASYSGGSDEKPPAGAVIYLQAMTSEMRKVGATDAQVIAALTNGRTLFEAITEVCQKRGQS